MNYWLIKSDPETYDWKDLVRDGGTRWDGVRNAQARIFLRTMKKGDQALFYHSQTDKAVVGVVRITATAYPDPTDKEGKWVCVDIAPVEAWDTPVSIAAMRSKPLLKETLFLRQGRLSVSPLTKQEWECIQALRYAP